MIAAKRSRKIAESRISNLATIPAKSAVERKYELLTTTTATTADSGVGGVGGVDVDELRRNPPPPCYKGTHVHTQVKERNKQVATKMTSNPVPDWQFGTVRWDAVRALYNEDGQGYNRKLDESLDKTILI